VSTASELSRVWSLQPASVYDATMFVAMATSRENGYSRNFILVSLWLQQLSS